MDNDNLHKGAHPELFRFARENRKDQTDAEKILWECLRNRKLSGYKFRRQHPVYDFIADFFCMECRLAIEVDGAYHEHVEQAQRDAGRTYELEEIGIKVIRFTNTEIVNRTDFVLCEIKKHLASRKQ